MTTLDSIKVENIEKLPFVKEFIVKENEKIEKLKEEKFEKAKLEEKEKVEREKSST